MVSFACFLASLPAAFAAVLPRVTDPSVLYRFEGGWIENMALRPNGHLLVTRMDSPDLWDVDPSTQEATKVFTFPDAGAGGGLVEMGDDVFAVVAGNYSLASGNNPGTWRIWSVDLSGDEVSASAVKTVEESVQFNGLTAMDDDTLLIGDMAGGAVYLMGFFTGEYSLLKKDPSMDPGTPLPFGIDGMKFLDGYLYYTNIGKGTFQRMPISKKGNAGDIEVIYDDSPGDDFVFDEEGNAYIATNTGGTVIKITPWGDVETLGLVEGGTCVVLLDGVLYVGTSGGLIVTIEI